ncbi:hypothetical protein Tco_0532657 [Tanacetum coccineum]
MAAAKARYKGNKIKQNTMFNINIDTIVVPNTLYDLSENQESASSASKDLTAASSKRGRKSERDDGIGIFLVELGL